MTKAPDAISVELLADRPELIAQVGHMTWLEWGYGAKDPEPFIKVIAQEAGRDGLPISLVAVDAAGSAVGKVGLGGSDGDLSQAERRDRSPWVIGMIVRRENRLQHVGRLLLSKMEERAAAQGFRQVWVATGDEAVGFYRQCGWRDTERLRPVSTGVPTTILTKQL
jgi:GNAT superfamily N-acetyltransferase